MINNYNNKTLKLLLAISLFIIPSHLHAQTAACPGSTGSTIAAQFVNTTAAFGIDGDITVVTDPSEPTPTLSDVNTANFIFGPDAETDIYVAVTITPGAIMWFQAGALVNIYGDLTNNGNMVIEPGAVVNFYGQRWTNSTSALVVDGAAMPNSAPGGIVNFIAPRPAVPASYIASNGGCDAYSLGNFQQEIDGGDVAMDMELHVQNTNNIQLVNSPARLEGTLVFDVIDGDISLGNNNLIFTANGTWNSNVAPNEAFILTNGASACSGMVEKEALAPNATFLFPIGRAETYAGGRDYTPAILRNDGAAADDFQILVKDYAETVATGVIIQTPGEGMDRAWQITSTSGSGVTMNLQHNDFTNGTDYTTVFGGDPNAFITQYQGAGLWDVGPIGTDITGTVAGAVIHSRGFSISSTATNCGEPNSWYTKSPDMVSPLPVVLSAFSVEIDNACQAGISWKTASESEVKLFVVEYSSEGHTFTTIGQQAPRNAATGSTYLLRWSGMPQGLGYYRLRIVDINGGYSYSPTLQQLANCGSRSISIAPNPATSFVQVSGPDAGSRIAIYAINGALVAGLTTTGPITQVPVGHLASGTYTIRVTSPSGQVLTTEKLEKI